MTELPVTALYLLLGLAALFFGGDLLVRGAGSVARHFRLSPMVIGLTIVGFGTSAPELLVSVQASLSGQPSIAIGNVLGSNISNILLILGASAALAPLVIHVSRLWRDFAVLLGSTALIWWMLADGMLSRFDGLILLLALVGFVLMALKTGEAQPVADTPLPPQWQAWTMVVVGLVVLVIGANLLVDSATTIARLFGVSEAVIGLTIVAVGTSLPELATSIVATLRRNTDIAVGNVVGSNIFNVLGILGVAALARPMAAEPRFAGFDMYWVAAVSVTLILAVTVLGGLPRKAGFGLLAGYLAYVILLS